MKDIYRKSRIIEIIATILINAIIGGVIYYNVSGALSKPETRKTVRHMNITIEEVYTKSS
ncbi:MAG: hypothetical protein IJG34_00660 [Synergistaceae bacterium]|nr:hypothetical protein [Synergistaceae bacterium]MBQ3448398.1 hypothetical protein [Synergistaceae bacterium]MBQ9629544.1 hypothetical protein [Synergistaceae bacterium]